MKQFKLQNYNEFKNHVRWHDYISFIINEFPIILVRKYDFDLHSKESTSVLTIQILGMKIL